MLGTKKDAIIYISSKIIIEGRYFDVIIKKREV